MAKKKTTPAKSDKFMISQSFIKDTDRYLAKELCGNVYESKYVKRNYPDRPSASMAVGTYFEYLATGALPKSGEIPQPMYMKGKGPTDGIEGLYADYRRAARAAERFKDDLRGMGCKVVEFGQRVTREDYEGTIDAIVEFTGMVGLERVESVKIGTRVLKPGDRFIIDLKYSGLIDETWTVFGWPVNPARWTPAQKRYNGHQAKTYTFLKNGLPYFFYVAASDTKSEGERVFFEITGLTEEVIAEHLRMGRKMAGDIPFFQEIGFTAWPSHSHCKDCPLAEGCKDKKTFKDAIQVDLGTVSED